MTNKVCAKSGTQYLFRVPDVAQTSGFVCQMGGDMAQNQEKRVCHAWHMRGVDEVFAKMLLFAITL